MSDLMSASARDVCERCGQVIVMKDGHKCPVISVGRDVVAAVLDIAVGSMDFSSGFLDDEEVSALRTLAVVLGLDPIGVTPEAFRCKYTGEHQWPDWNRPGTDTNCLRCRTPRPADVVPHTWTVITQELQIHHAVRDMRCSVCGVAAAHVIRYYGDRRNPDADELRAIGVTFHCSKR